MAATGSAEQAISQAPQRATNGIAGLWQRLKKAPPWVWIAIVVAVAGVIIAYMTYRKQQNAANSATQASAADGSVPSGGSGQPNWQGSDSGMFATSNDAQWQALLQYLLQFKPPVPTPAPPVAPPSGGPQPPVPTGGSGGYGLGPVPGTIFQVQPWQQGRLTQRFGGFARGFTGSDAQQSGLPAPATGGTPPAGTGVRRLWFQPPQRF